MSCNIRPSNYQSHLLRLKRWNLNIFRNKDADEIRYGGYSNFKLTTDNLLSGLSPLQSVVLMWQSWRPWQLELGFLWRVFSIKNQIYAWVTDKFKVIHRAVDIHTAAGLSITTLIKNKNYKQALRKGAKNRHWAGKERSKKPLMWYFWSSVKHISWVLASLLKNLVEITWLWVIYVHLFLYDTTSHTHTCVQKHARK